MALQGMEDITKRNAIASKLYGGAGEELIPLLNAGKGSIEGFKKELVDLGGIMSEEAIASGVKFNEELIKLQFVVKSALIPVMEQLTPMIESFGTDVLPMVISAIKFLIEHIGKILPVLAGIMAAFKAVAAIVAVTGAAITGTGLLIAAAIGAIIGLGVAIS